MVGSDGRSGLLAAGALNSAEPTGCSLAILEFVFVALTVPPSILKAIVRLDNSIKLISKVNVICSQRPRRNVFVAGNDKWDMHYSRFDGEIDE